MFGLFTAASANDRGRPTIKISRNTVSLLIRHAEAQGWLTLEDLNGLSNASFSKALVNPDSHTRDETFKMPDFEKVHR